MTFAMDNPAPATIVLITGDRDFVYPVSILRMRRYRVILIAPNNTHGSLRYQASSVLHWEQMVGKPSRPSFNTSDSTLVDVRNLFKPDLPPHDDSIPPHTMKRGRSYSLGGEPFDCSHDHSAFVDLVDAPIDAMRRAEYQFDNSAPPPPFSGLRPSFVPFKVFLEVERNQVRRSEPQNADITDYIVQTGPIYQPKNQVTQVSRLPKACTHVTHITTN